MRKVLWVILVILLIGILFFIIKFNKNDKKIENNIQENNLQNNLNISKTNNITQNFVETRKNKKEKTENDEKQASSDIQEKEKSYLIKSNDGYINIYLVENKKEILYKITSISVDYLSQKDRNDLEKGINAKGIEEVNEILENFE